MPEQKCLFLSGIMTLCAGGDLSASPQCEYEPEIFDTGETGLLMTGFSDSGSSCGYFGEFLSDVPCLLFEGELEILQLPGEYQHGRPRAMNASNEVVGRLIPNSGPTDMGFWSGDALQVVEPNSGFNVIVPEDMNERGVVVGTLRHTVFGERLSAFLWNPGDSQAVVLSELLSASASYAGAINDHGIVTGGCCFFEDCTEDDSVLFVLDTISFEVQFFPLQDTGEHPVPAGINNHGHIVGVAEDDLSNENRPFLFRNGVFEFLPMPGGSVQAWATMINDAGIITGYFKDEMGGLHPVLWHELEVYELQDLVTGDDSLGLRFDAMVNNSGQVFLEVSHPSFSGTQPAILHPVSREPSDIDDDCDVDVNDLLLLLSQWGEPGGVADLDDSGAVDVDDLLILLGDWGG